MSTNFNGERFIWKVLVLFLIPSIFSPAQAAVLGGDPWTIPLPRKAKGAKG